MILAGYGNRCAVSGLKSATLVEAAHIIPWAEDESLRLQPANGIALNSLLHRAYDCFLIGIDGERRVHVSRELRVGAEDSRLQSFFESINGAALQLSRHFTPSPELLERRFAQYRERISF
ncbi:HNH endonuclease [Sutterella massiliensis]